MQNRLGSSQNYNTETPGVYRFNKQAKTFY